MLCKAKPSFDVPIIPPPDNEPLYPTTCQTFPLKESPSLNYYFGYNGISLLSPKAAHTFFRYEPNVSIYCTLKKIFIFQKFI